MKRSVLIGAESQILRDALREQLEKGGEFQVVAEARDGAELVAAGTRTRTNLVVVAFAVEFRAGVEAIRQLRIGDSRSRFAVLAVGGARPPVEDALRAGASAYLSPAATASVLREALHAIARGQFYFSPDITSDLAQVVSRPFSAPHGISALTEREQQVLRLIADGFSNREIAENLRISRRTVDGHRSKLMEKLDLHKASSLVRFAIREGLVAP